MSYKNYPDTYRPAELVCHFIDFGGSMSDAIINASSAGEWWYADEKDTRGPFTNEEMAKLVSSGSLQRNTAVWREDFGQEWKTLSQTSLLNELRPVNALPNDARSDIGPYWQEKFTRFDQKGEYYHESSWKGLVLGPIYHLWLGMRRKAFMIIGLSFWLALLLHYVFALFGKYSGPLYAIAAANVYCHEFVTRDYYRLKRHGDRLWAPFHRLGNPMVIAAITLLPFYFIAPNDSRVVSNNKQAFVRLQQMSPVAEESNWVVQARRDNFAGRINTGAVLTDIEGKHAGLLVNCDGGQTDVDLALRDDVQELAQVDHIDPVFKFGQQPPVQGVGFKIGEEDGRYFFQIYHPVDFLNLLRDDQDIYVRIETQSRIADYDFKPRGSAYALSFLSSCGK